MQLLQPADVDKLSHNKFISPRNLSVFTATNETDLFLELTLFITLMFLEES